MDRELVRLAQTVKKHINSDIYKTSQEIEVPAENITVVENLYLKNLGAIYLSVRALFSGKTDESPILTEVSVETIESVNRFFDYLRGLLPSLDENDKILYLDMIENYFKVYPWIISKSFENEEN